MSQDVQSWRFPRMFWTGNAAELCERAAYYGTFIALGLYLNRVVGLDDVQAGWVAGLFGSWIYLVPFFTGALADRIGFRNALMIAFALLTLGYGALGFFHTMTPVGVEPRPSAPALPAPPRRARSASWARTTFWLRTRARWSVNVSVLPAGAERLSGWSTCCFTPC